MNKKTTTFRYLMVVTLLELIAAAAAQAETINCTPVNSLPAVISNQGVYCLTGNLATNISSSNAIEISANNVTLDLNGWKVGGQAAGLATLATGIYSGADNVTIKNGIVRGFYDGIRLTGRGAVVEDMLIDQNTYGGINVTGKGSIVRRNQVVDTGGSTKSAGAYGIATASNGDFVEDNEVSGLTSTGGSETGIQLTGNFSTARHNIVTDDARPTGGVDSYGIVSAAVEVSLVENVISNFSYGIEYADLTGSGIYARNTVTDCDTPYYRGTAGSGNDHD
jgi:hypothetical protein